MMTADSGPDAGVIYVLTNTRAEDFIIIDYAEGEEVRLWEAEHGESFPVDFDLYCYYEVESFRAISVVRRLLAEAPPEICRPAFDDDCGYYQMSAEAAYEFLSAIAAISGTADRLKKTGPLRREVFDPDDREPLTPDEPIVWVQNVLGVTVGIYEHEVEAFRERIPGIRDSLIAAGRLDPVTWRWRRNAATAADGVIEPPPKDMPEPLLAENTHGEWTWIPAEDYPWYRRFVAREKERHADTGEHAGNRYTPPADRRLPPFYDSLSDAALTNPCAEVWLDDDDDGEAPPDCVPKGRPGKALLFNHKGDMIWVDADDTEEFRRAVTRVKLREALEAARQNLKDASPLPELRERARKAEKRRQDLETALCKTNAKLRELSAAMRETVEKEAKKEALLTGQLRALADETYLEKLNHFYSSHRDEWEAMLRRGVSPEAAVVKMEDNLPEEDEAESPDPMEDETACVLVENQNGDLIWVDARSARGFQQEVQKEKARREREERLSALQDGFYFRKLREKFPERREAWETLLLVGESPAAVYARLTSRHKE